MKFNVSQVRNIVALVDFVMFPPLCTSVNCSPLEAVKAKQRRVNLFKDVFVDVEDTKLRYHALVEYYQSKQNPKLLPKKEVKWGEWALILARTTVERRWGLLDEITRRNLKIVDGNAYGINPIEDACWKKPNLKHLKVNVDAGMADSSSYLGVVIRDNMGNLVDVRTHKFSEMEIGDAEALAILKGAEFAREKQQEDYKDWKIEIETDSLPGKLKAEGTMSLFYPDMKVKFVFREGNYVAHRVVEWRKAGHTDEEIKLLLSDDIEDEKLERPVLRFC